MSEERSFRFGPGSLESIKLRVWEQPAGDVRGEASGLYRVYCGEGAEHLVEIDEEFSLSLQSPTEEIDEHLSRAWKLGDADAAEAVSHQAIEWALEGWSDPCVDDEEEH